MIRRFPLPPPGTQTWQSIAALAEKHAAAPSDYVVIKTAGNPTPRLVWKLGDPDFKFPIGASERITVEIIPAKDIT